MTLVILAAGMGSRYGGLKQIDPINDSGEYIIDYSIYDAIQMGFDKVVCIIKREIYDIFRETFGKRIEKYIDVEYTFQEIDDLPEGFDVPEGRVKPWGTVHAILTCKDVVKDNFAIINADDFYGRDAFRVIRDFMKNCKDENAMVGYKVINTLTEHGAVKRAVCEVNNGCLEKMTESSVEIIDGNIVAKPLNGQNEFVIDSDKIVSLNMFVFSPKIFDVLEKQFIEFLNNNKDNMMKCEHIISDAICEQLENGLIDMKVLSTSGKWIGVTYKEDKEKLVCEMKKIINAGEYPERLWNL